MEKICRPATTLYRLPRIGHLNLRLTCPTPIVSSAYTHNLAQNWNHVTVRHYKAQKSLIPNILTVSRIVVTPAIGYFMWNGMYSDALNFFIFAAITDFLDGFLARILKQESHIGAILDPIADKLLLGTCLVAGFHSGLLPVWYVKGLIMRDLIVLTGAACVRYTSFREKPDLKKFLDFKNYPTLGLEPIATSKICTALQCAVLVTQLSTNHLVGDYYYDWGIAGLQFTTAVFASTSTAQYAYRILNSDPARSAKPRLKL